MNRRTFATRLALATPLLPLFAAAPRRLPAFGFIAGIVGREMKADWKGTLGKAAALGYTQLETSNHFGESPRDFVDHCKQVGIQLVGGGVPMNRDFGQVEKKLDALAEMNMKYAVTYWPWFSGGPFTLDDCRTSCEALNRMGEAARERGLKFCWHNHDKEFAEADFGRPFDYLMTHTEPGLVSCEMDVYWVAKGNADPLRELRRYRGRYLALHLKDMKGDGTRDFECPGAGILAWRDILKEASRQRVAYHLVERDKVEDGLACLAGASAFLRGIKF